MLERLNYWIQQTTPLVYDDSVSYYEVLLKVQGKMNEVIDALEVVENVQIDYIDEKTQAVRNELSSLQAYLKAYTDEEVAKWRTEQTDTFEDALQSTAEGITAAYQADDDAISADYNAKHNYALGLITSSSLAIIDPLTGKTMTTQEAINSIFDSTRTAPLTATAFDALNKTVTVLDGLQVTAKNYDMTASTYIY